ncbi:hypothetical protein BH09ACT13_BH09ACT13_10530 [soil metagenome]
MDPATKRPSAFFLYRESALRREALRLGPGAGERYSLYGLDELGAGFDVAHNLEPEYRPGAYANAASGLLRRSLGLLGGYPGDFASVLACRSALNGADVVFSTVDTVGIPLALLARAGLVRSPIVYAAIGLPERLAELRNDAIRRLYRSAYRGLQALVAYGWGEVDALREWLGEGAPPVHFVPFGVDEEYFRPEPGRDAELDVVSIGADTRRDHELLVGLAKRRPEWTFLVVATREYAQALGSAPANLRVELDVPLHSVRERLRSARIVVLPVRDNTYSGATTVLLQAMATAKPVVVSRTAAIAHGYELDDGGNCVLVTPGDTSALEHAVAGLLDDRERAAAIGARARETIERHLTWKRYTAAIRALLLEACGRTTVSG